MANLTYANMGISSMAGAVSSNTIKNKDYTEFFDKEIEKEIVDKTGILQRRLAPPHLMASDLCFHAAKKLL